MHRILFVCHGNICRSPMAEFLMKDLVKKQDSESEFYILSAATSTEEIGNPVYYKTAEILDKLNISYKGKVAVQMTKKDYDKFDYIIAMDSQNIRNIFRIIKDDPECKVFKLLDFCDGGDIADPWYTRDFEKTYNEISKGCTALFNKLCNNF